MAALETVKQGQLVDEDGTEGGALGAHKAARWHRARRDAAADLVRASWLMLTFDDEGSAGRRAGYQEEGQRSCGLDSRRFAGERDSPTATQLAQFPILEWRAEYTSQASSRLSKSHWRLDCWDCPIGALDQPLVALRGLLNPLGSRTGARAGRRGDAAGVAEVIAPQLAVQGWDRPFHGFAGTRRCVRYVILMKVKADTTDDQYAAVLLGAGAMLAKQRT